MPFKGENQYEGYVFDIWMCIVDIQSHLYPECFTNISQVEHIFTCLTQVVVWMYPATCIVDIQFYMYPGCLLLLIPCMGYIFTCLIYKLLNCCIHTYPATCILDIQIYMYPGCLTNKSLVWVTYIFTCLTQCIHVYPTTFVDIQFFMYPECLTYKSPAWITYLPA